MQIGWYDRTDGNYGWVDVLNTTDYWYSRSSKDTRWARMPEPNGWNDGDWTIGGQSVKLYVRNPENSSGFTPNDIVFSYGWFG